MRSIALLIYIFALLESSSSFIVQPFRPTGLTAAVKTHSLSPLQSSQKSRHSSNTKSYNNITNVQTLARPVKQRRKSRNRKPKFYWQHDDNFYREIIKFWQLTAGIDDKSIQQTYNNQQPRLRQQKSRPLLLVPNETLLRYFGRHDLRAAIASRGGRTALIEDFSNSLYDLQVQPGKWKDAVQHEYMRRLLSKHKELLVDSPPKLDVKNKDKGQQDRKTTKARRPWSHTPNRQIKGYWDLYRLVEELYRYTDDYRKVHGRPAVWMPRGSEFTHNSRPDIKQAIDRYGGTKRIAKLAGMVAYHEWDYFDGQLRLLILLDDYVEKHSLGNVFPVVSDISRNGQVELYNLIRYYGGRNMLASRFGMMTISSKRNNNKPGQLKDATATKMDLNWGKFDIKFAIELLTFIRQTHYHRSPPLAQPVLAIPSPMQLLKAGRQDLHEKIENYGGYENVARRLGLDFDLERKF